MRYPVSMSKPTSATPYGVNGQYVDAKWLMGISNHDVIQRPVGLFNERSAGHISPLTWWRHQMETFSALLALCAGTSPVTGEFPTQSPVTQGFDVFFDLRLNKRLSKQSWGWWFETPSRPLWRHCNEIIRACTNAIFNDRAKIANKNSLCCQNTLQKYICKAFV